MSDQEVKKEQQTSRIMLKAQDNLEFDIIDEYDFEESDEEKSRYENQNQSQANYELLQIQEYMNT